MEEKSKDPNREYPLTIPHSKLHEFWKYFQNAGNQVKQNMISTVTWALALASGILSYLVGKLHMFGKVESTDLTLGRIVAGLGISLCVYVIWLIHEFSEAMVGNWDKADKIGKEIPKQEGSKISIRLSERPSICLGMYLIAGGLTIAFLVGFFLLFLCH